jgi:hypothetical protein
MGIKISKDHLHLSVIESIVSLIGDLSQLETTAKGNAVEAINELLANGGNKEELEALIAELKSILEDEGVEVLEEDTMADLIVKVDEEFDRKNANTVLEVEGTCTFKELTNGVNIGFQPTNVYISLPYSSGYNGKHVRCFFQDKYTKQAVSLYIIDGQWEQNAYGIEPTATGFYGYLGISVSDSTVVTYKACKYF